MKGVIHWDKIRDTEGRGTHRGEDDVKVEAEKGVIRISTKKHQGLLALTQL